MTMSKLTRIFLSVAAVVFLAASALFAQDYKLEQVTIASRHSVRAPLEKNISRMSEIVADPTCWHKWSVPGSNLTLKGGALEVLMGQYFKLYYAQEGLFPVNNDSTDGIYIAASSRQRTIATARSFAAGFLPLATVAIDYMHPEGSADSAFLPLLNDSAPGFDADAFQTEAQREITEIIKENAADLKSAYTLLENVVGFEHSYVGAQKKHLDTWVGVAINFRRPSGERNEPSIIGDLKLADIASDAIILQYLEEPDLLKAGFGHNLSLSEWRTLSSIKDIYGKILFTAPIVAVNVSHDILERIYQEMNVPGRKFSFLCMHDTSIQALLTALQAEPYILPEETTIEAITPIGFKFIIEKYDLDGEKFARLRLVYQTSDQIRNQTILDLDTPPATFDLRFKGLTPNADGYYKWDDVEQRIQATLAAFSKTAKGERPF